MPKIKVNGLTLNYDQQGAGEPLVLIPFLSADSACYAFQVSEYAKHFTCITVDLRGTGESDKPEGVYSTELFADDIAAFMQALGIERAHVSGLSLGAVVGMWLAARHPQRVKSLSVHGGWPRTDPFLKTIVEGFQVMAKSLGNVAETVILGIFPWCFTPELYSAKPEYVQSLADFIRSRPAQPVDAFIRHTNAVISHNVEAQLPKIQAPTQITFGRQDLLTSLRFAEPLKSNIRNSELFLFEGCAHAPIYENVDQFNKITLEFLGRNSS
jgi:pimeloyl-ACP methyl ester carboxylesterase